MPCKWCASAAARNIFSSAAGILPSGGYSPHMRVFSPGGGVFCPTGNSPQGGYSLQGRVFSPAAFIQPRDRYSPQGRVFSPGAGVLLRCGYSSQGRLYSSQGRLYSPQGWVFSPRTRILFRGSYILPKGGCSRQGRGIIRNIFHESLHVSLVTCCTPCIRLIPVLGLYVS